MDAKEEDEDEREGPTEAIALGVAAGVAVVAVKLRRDEGGGFDDVLLLDLFLEQVQSSLSTWHGHVEA